MSHPLLRVVCLYAAGVLLGSVGDIRWLCFFALCVVATLTLSLVRRWRSVLPGALVLLVGWTNQTYQSRVRPAHDLRRLLPPEPVLADVRGRLTETPRITLQTRDGLTRARTLAELDVTLLRTNRGRWQPATGRIVVSSGGCLGPAYHRRQTVVISGVLAPPAGPRAPGLFDYARYLEHRGIHFQFRADDPGDWALCDDSLRSPPWSERFVHWARGTLSRGLPGDDPATGLIQAMTLGWKTSLTDEVEEPFMQSGTMHVFAISGLHIALIAGILLALLRLVRVPRGFCGLLLIPILWFYTGATGWQPSAVRASLMMTVVLGGWALRRPSFMLNSLAAAALLILVVDPRQLFQASFQLSFAVVLSLAIVLPPLKDRLQTVLEPDAMLPADRIPAWKRRVGGPLRWLAMTLATSGAAWLGSMPLTATYFHIFSPGTLLANLLVLPCAGAALASALGSLVTGAWWPWACEVFNHGAWFWMHCMMTVSAAVARVPGAHCYVPAPWACSVMLFYGMLLMVGIGGFAGERLRGALGGCLIVLVALGWTQAGVARSRTSLTILPLNGGMAVHVKRSGRWRPLLLDSGGARTFDTALKPFLHARGENRVDTLLVTHGDARHMGAADRVLEEFAPARVAFSPVRFRSRPYRTFVDTTVPNRLDPIRIARGDDLDGWGVLFPPRDLQVRRADSGVLVLRGVLKGTTVLLLSDLDREGQRTLLELAGPGELEADLVVVGLPETGEPLGNDLLRRIDPAVVVVGDDEWPAGRRASADLLNRLQRSGAAVLSTRREGALRFSFTSRGWKAKDASGRTLLRGAPKPQVSNPPPVDAARGLSRQAPVQRTNRTRRPRTSRCREAIRRAGRNV